MSKYILSGFDIRGKVEIARLLFAAAGVQYKDNRIPEFTEGYGTLLKKSMSEWKYSSEWLALKPTTPFNQLPMLEVDGVTITHNKSIQDFLARRFNLAGKTDLDQARVSMISEAIDDALYAQFEKLMMINDAEKKAAAVKKYQDETLPRYFGNLEKLAGDNGHFVAGQLTQADISLFHQLDFLKNFKLEDEVEKYTKLKAIRDNVAKNPGVAKWISERPDNMF